MIDKFLKYGEFYSNPELKKGLCETFIRSILKKYSRIEWLYLITSIAKGILLGSDKNIILSAQQRLLGFIDGILFHRRANLTLIQFLLDINESDFKRNFPIKRKDILDIYLLINEFLDICETENQKNDYVFILFTTFKIVHTSFNENDLKFTLELFNEYYDKIEEQPNSDAIKKIVTSNLGFDFGTISSFLNNFLQDQKRNFNNPLSFVNQIVGLDYELIDETWEKRKPKLGIPYEYNFLEEAAIIHYHNEYFVYDVFNLFYSIIRRIYNVLFNQSVFDFPNYFGKEIVEPVLIKRLQSQFQDSYIEILKVKTNKKEYADFGIKHRESIFLFEIKSVFFKPSIRYSNNIDYFMRSFDGKYVNKSGVDQQVQRIKDLDNEFEYFMSINNIETKKYIIYPVLILFDESLQCFRRNLYLDLKYKERISYIKLKNISASDHYASFTINEMESLKIKHFKPDKQLEIIKDFLQIQQQASPFRFFLETL